MSQSRQFEMRNSIHEAFFKKPFQGFMNRSGLLLTRMDTGLEKLFLRSPENGYEKGGLNPHGYWLREALTETTSYRRTAFSGRLLSGRIWRGENNTSNTPINCGGGESHCACIAAFNRSITTGGSN